MNACSYRGNYKPNNGGIFFAELKSKIILITSLASAMIRTVVEKNRWQSQTVSLRGILKNSA